MSYVNKVNVAGTLFDIQDIRIDGIDNVAASGSTNLITSGGVYTSNNNLQNQIDAITAQSDVVDVVANYAELVAYSKQIYKDDIVKVLQDESTGHNNAISYYRAGANSPTYNWTWIGSQGPFYTKGETDGLLSGKANSSHTHVKSQITDFPTLATVATSGSYNDLSNKPTIPTVNNATLTIQKNGTNVATFTANSASNATANISVPTQVSELTNDSNYATQAYAATVGPVTSVNGSTGAVTTRQVPTCTTSDNNKFLRVVNGAAAWVALDSAEAQVF